MSTRIEARMTSQGLLIPCQELPDWEDVEVVKEGGAIVIRPMTSSRSERERGIQALREDGLLVEMEKPLHPSASPEERAELAKKFGLGRPLSEIVIEERETR